MKLTTSFAPTISVLLFSLLVTVRPAEAQVLYGSIVGTVQDISGSAVPEATVAITNNATGQSHETTTSSDGLYSFVDILPGPYTVTVTAKGFRTSRTTNTQVSINTVTRVDAQLQVGERAETVTVEASAAAMQTDSSTSHRSLASLELR